MKTGSFYQPIKTSPLEDREDIVTWFKQKIVDKELVREMTLHFQGFSSSL